MRSMLPAVGLLALSVAAAAHEGPHTGGLVVEPDPAVVADFDIVHAKVSTTGNLLTFHMAVSGKAGATQPAATGKLAGSDVFSYVWPTTIDPYEVGFERGAGILSMA